MHGEGEKEYVRAEHYKSAYERLLARSRDRGLAADEGEFRDRDAGSRIVSRVAHRINEKLKSVIEVVRGADATGAADSGLQAPSAAIFEPLLLELETDRGVEDRRQRHFEAGQELARKIAVQLEILGMDATEEQVMRAVRREDEAARSRKGRADISL